VVVVVGGMVGAVLRSSVPVIAVVVVGCAGGCRMWVGVVVGGGGVDGSGAGVRGCCGVGCSAIGVVCGVVGRHWGGGGVERTVVDGVVGGGLVGIAGGGVVVGASSMLWDFLLLLVSLVVSVPVSYLAIFCSHLLIRSYFGFWQPSCLLCLKFAVYNGLLVYKLLIYFCIQLQIAIYYILFPLYVSGYLCIIISG
jgi:hypothetical protein